MYQKKKCIFVLSIIAAFIIFYFVGNYIIYKSVGEEEKSLEYEIQMQKARTTPYGKYPQLITYSLGKLTDLSNSNMPKGDSYENNAYTRFIRKILNVQNKNKFESVREYYNNIVSMTISDKEIPDIMVVQDLSTLGNLIQNDLIEDLTYSYNQCASKRIKQYYDSYSGKALEPVIYNGKIMALPGVNIDYGPNVLWVRKDWMEKLNLKDPKTIEDVVEIVKEFITKDPGRNGTGNTVGLVCDANVTGNYDLQYQLDLIFASFHAFPKKWIRTKQGTICYGSITKETKQALAYLNKLYQEGILDNQFLIRTSDNISELIIEGKCGTFFAPWWAPNNPLMSAYEKDKSVNWQPYFIATNEDGSCKTYTPKASEKYVVVRKGFEYPELAIKIINVLFDKERYSKKDVEELQNYYAENVDPIARPIAINVDHKEAYFICSQKIQKVLRGEMEEQELTTLENSYYHTCKNYLESDEPTVEEWAAYMSRITVANLLQSHKIHYVEDIFVRETKEVQFYWWSLEQLEKETFLKIITGEEEIHYFDSFVRQWNIQGGEEITRQVNEQKR